jgi:hypothetical protein
MVHPRLSTLLLITLAASIISLGAPWTSVATLGRIRLAVTVTTTMVAFIAAFATAVLAVVVHGTRGLWAILAAAPALFWPVFAVSIVSACSIYDCD